MYKREKRRRYIKTDKWNENKSGGEKIHFFKRPVTSKPFITHWS